MPKFMIAQYIISYLCALNVVDEHDEYQEFICIKCNNMFCTLQTH